MDRKSVQASRSKYRNRRTAYDGINFASKREAYRYGELKLAERAGVIRELKLQVPFKLCVNGQLICTYKADFCYEEKFKGHWKRVTEDCKGILTPVYRIKKKLLKAIHGVDILET